MLNCILGMVDKTKRALSILQQRSNVTAASLAAAGAAAAASTPAGAGASAGLFSPTLAAGGGAVADPSGVDPLTRRTMEMVVEVRRRAEEAVSEVLLCFMHNG